MCNHHHPQSVSFAVSVTMKITTSALILLLLALVAVTKAGDARRRLTTEELTGSDGRLNTNVLRYGLQWEAWKATHRRGYLTLVEELERFVIWRANQAFIDYHNSYANKLGFTLRMNQFGDLVRDWEKWRERGSMLAVLVLLQGRVHWNNIVLVLRGGAGNSWRLWPLVITITTSYTQAIGASL